MFLENNKLTVITSPNYFYGKQPSILMYDIEDCDMNIIMEVLLQKDIPLSLFLGHTSKSERDWLLNIARQVDHVVVNLENIDLVKGYILNYPYVSYYNEPTDINGLNLNRLDDPIEFVVRFINGQDGL